VSGTGEQPAEEGSPAFDWGTAMLNRCPQSPWAFMPCRELYDPHNKVHRHSATWVYV